METRRGMRRALIKRNAPSFPSLRPYLSIPRVFRVYADHLLFFFSFPSSSSSSPLLFSSFLFFSSPSQRDNSFLLLANVIARTRFPAGIRRNHGIRDGSPRVPRLIFTPRAMEQRRSSILVPCDRRDRSNLYRREFTLEVVRF